MIYFFLQAIRMELAEAAIRLVPSHTKAKPHSPMAHKVISDPHSRLLITRTTNK